MRSIGFLSCLIFALAGCGGGSGDSSGTGSGSGSGGSGSGSPDTSEVQGLELPENFSVLSAQDDGIEAQQAQGPATLAAKFGNASVMAAGDGAFDDAGTDYSSDKSRVYVEDESMDALNLVNEILCYMGQSGASEMVNEGPYIALVNEDLCRQGENQSSSGETGQSSAGGATAFNRWVIESSRADNDSPQVVHLWVPDSGDRGEGEPAENILVEMTVHDGASDELPFGRFTMNFRGVADGAEVGGTPGTEMEMMRGMLATVDNDQDKPQFRLLTIGGDELALGADIDFGFRQAANVRLDDAGGTSGVARTMVADYWSFEGPSGPEEGSFEESFTIAYDDTRFLGALDDDDDGVTDEMVCRARDEFDVHVWRYNLYHRDDGDFRGRTVTAGQRVALSSGFPFSYDGDNDGVDDSHGWLGYHGMWTETDEVLADGAEISRHDYDSDTSVPYTIRVSAGKLIRRTASQEPLADFEGREFHFWGEHPVHQVWDQWVVHVTPDNRFEITARLQWTETGPEYSDAIDHDGNPETNPVAVGAVFLPEEFSSLHLWSEELGGDVVYTHDNAVAASQRMVTLYASQLMEAGDSAIPATLYCYDGCLIGGLTQDDIDSATDSFDLFHEYTGTPFSYSVSVNDGRIVLTDDSNDAVVSAVGLDLSALGHDWGINTGEMITSALADPNQPWEVWNATTSYHWETGPNHWNILMTAIDAAGNAVSFDRPLQIAYTHSASNDANSDDAYEGERFQFNYEGPGNLHGFPWIEDEDRGSWHAAFALADGTMLSEGDDVFIVRALEREQTMSEIDESECASLDAEAVRSDTNLALPEAEDIGSVTLSWADRPVVTDAPAVIEGEVQDSD